MTEAWLVIYPHDEPHFDAKGHCRCMCALCWDDYCCCADCVCGLE